MSNLEKKLRDEWRRLRAEYNDTLAGCSFDFNGRLKRSLGRCRYRWDGTPCIVELSKRLLHPTMERQAFDTLYHEVAHAMAGCEAGHGPEWQEWCRTLGAKPKSFVNHMQDLTADEREALRSTATPPKWKGECLGCGHTFTRRRVGQVTLRSATHGGYDCGGNILWTDRRTGRTYETNRDS